ncbi:type II CRISPR RNA-guided endonuclease Cas9 [Cytobacillus sp. IB215665]|uniref:type II CRISPR RNA-guided endonuclease Cas9 n=1 Tax=Cytobacillus sp. IB215665 TaxID=3097357 RepID=UPI002A14F153|nr:type II CRISPR RNA-guided endonuclease Cas9 [Cytobacillus sp. IB215665]MDX8367137.1 type II CRISPR RNA-guided endonuclease Cas9 [Cytobacillus sp. IB215665]
MKYSIGIDVGISSCGWAVINLDKNRIEDLGVRIFPKAEKEDGESITAARRKARSTRRTISRRRHRLERVKKLIARTGLYPANKIEALYKLPFDKSVWQLRTEALDRLLTNEEFTRVLIHLAKRRGFKSNRKELSSNTEKDKDNKNKPILSNLNENKEIMNNKKYRTVSEMMTLDDKFSKQKRNKPNNYVCTVGREDLQNEIIHIFKKQRSLGNTHASVEFEKKYINIWASQRPFSSKEQIKKMVGQCTLETNEKRAPKACFSSQKYIALKSINEIRIISSTEMRGLNTEERKKVLQLALQEKKVTYSDIRTLLSLDPSVHFNAILPSAESTELIKLSEYHKLKDALIIINGYENFTDQDLDTFSYALTMFKNETDIEDYLYNRYKNSKGKYQRNISNTKYDQQLIDALSTLSFSKFGNLSMKAIKKITPFLEEGFTYDKACEKAGYNFQGERKNKGFTGKLPLIGKDITNPVIKRSLSQSRQIINNIIQIYGLPHAIYIETARELKKTFEERKKIQEKNKANQEKNEKAKKKLLKYGIGDPKRYDIVKYKLWEEQNKRCIYTNKEILEEQLISSDIDTDHIIPFSRSFDDSYVNKVVCLKDENMQKGNKLPFEYFGHDEQRWNAFEERVQNSKISSYKKDKLLKEHFTEQEKNEFLRRNLHDTQGISKYLANFLKNHLHTNSGDDPKVEIHTIKGKFTSVLRSRWGFNKDRDKSDLHHAVDAVIIALITVENIQKITRYYQDKETNKLKGRKAQYFPRPWKHFSAELTARLSKNPGEILKKMQLDSYSDVDLDKLQPIFVSRRPNRSVTGLAHLEKVRKHIGKSEKGIELTCVKTPLSKIKLDKNGNFNMFGRESDPYTYNAIKQRLLEYDNKPAKAFEEELRKPTKSGAPGPIIKSVKIIEERNIVQSVHNGNGVVFNSEIVRSDVFLKDNKYFFVPIYKSDVIKTKLPNRAIAANKPYNEWPIIDESYTFQFSLYPNDLIKVVPSKSRTIKAKTMGSEKIQLTEMLGYYRSIHTGTAGITIESHDRSLRAEGLGSKTLQLIEKYQVDSLGRSISKVNGEKRMPFNKKRA